jgi:hypothetical protein
MPGGRFEAASDALALMPFRWALAKRNDEPTTQLGQALKRSLAALGLFPERD